MKFRDGLLVLALRTQHARETVAQRRQPRQKPDRGTKFRDRLVKPPGLLKRRRKVVMKIRDLGTDRQRTPHQHHAVLQTMHLEGDHAQIMQRRCMIRALARICR